MLSQMLVSMGCSNAMAKIVELLASGTLDTLYMVLLATFVSVVLGVPLGVLLLVTSKGYFWSSPRF